jgi:ubiquinone/menaquinone biosynthesis C-methylase UbiE
MKHVFTNILQKLTGLSFMMRQLLGKVKRKMFNLFRNKEEAVIRFKKGIWQTDEISNAFIKGSDASVASADMMDKEVNEFFLAHCLPTDKVLDIGCGHGIVSEFLSTNGIAVTAIDISEKMLHEFRERIRTQKLQIDIKQCDAYDLPFINEEFDVVVARMFLPHFPDWPTVLSEMVRVTKKGGKLLVHFPSKENADLAENLKIRDCRFDSSTDTANPWRFYAETDDNELNKVCQITGLTVVNRAPVSFFVDNRILGYQLGQKKYDDYMEKVEEYFKDEKVKNFALWFDKEIIAYCHPSLSYYNIITFRKS